MPSIRGLVAALFLLAIAATPVAPQAAEKERPVSRGRDRSQLVNVDQLIVKLRTPGAEKRALAATEVEELSRSAGVGLGYVRRMSGGAHVLRLPHAMTEGQVRALSQRLNAHPLVEYAEPDAKRYPDLSPNDTFYASKQWHYRPPYGANLPLAWDLTTGTADIVVAVLDTGLLPHPDIDSNINDGSGRVVAGYDFISSDCVDGNDGTAGRDADPTDAGDYISFANECFTGTEVSDSSWHGTHVAGTIGALTNNAFGVAGVNWGSKIQPVRVLGKGGGSISDIVEAIRWAAGVGTPANLTPAKVINLSLGGGGPCSDTEQDAIDDAVAAGAVVVVSAGNDAADMDDPNNAYSPASCANVITVAATDINGQLAVYSNYSSSVVEISGPGGDFSVDSGVLSTFNGGTTTANGSWVYAYLQGTSMAAPHVSGVASLLFSMEPALTPAQVLQKLQSTAKPFPQQSFFQFFNCNSRCGAGLLNAEAAVLSLADTTPDPFSFAPQTNLPRSTPVISAPADITGINARSKIRVTGGAYRINGGSFTTAQGYVFDGDQVEVRHTTSAAYNAQAHTILTVGTAGTVSGTFTTTTAVDTTPDKFVFVDRANAVPNETQVSNTVVIKGMVAAAPISITGGQYSLGCDGTFTNGMGMVSNNQRVCVRHTSASSHGVKVDTTLTVGGPSGSISDTFSSTTVAAPDTLPTAFKFTDRINVGLGVPIVSNAVIISGINVPVQVSVTAGVGQYSIGCNGNFTSDPGTIYPGQKVCVRHTSSVAQNMPTNTELTVGGMPDTFTSTTVSTMDTTPSAFAFTDRTNVPMSMPLVSNTVTILGINTPTPISVTGDGGYSIGCSGTFKMTDDVINSGQKVCVSHLSGANPGQHVVTTLTVGGAPPATFDSTTVSVSADPQPNVFTLTDRVNAPYDARVVSNTITVAGINAPAPISITDGEYSIGCNGTFTPNSGFIHNGQKVCVRHVSNANPGGQVISTLDIGGVTEQFKSTTTTAAMDPVPTAFKFTDRTNVEHAIMIVSNTLTISGFNKSVPISVSNGDYSIGCLPAGFTDTAGTISPGEKVCVRHVSASQPGAWVDTILTIGSVADAFSSVTRNGPPNTPP